MELCLITIAWLFGILSGLYFKIGIALFSFSIFIVFLLKRKWYFHGICVSKYFFIFLLCYFISYLQIVNLEKLMNEKYQNKKEIQVVGTIISNPHRQEYKTTYTINVESVNGDISYQNTNLLLEVKKEKNNTYYSYGDKISFIGEFEEPQVQRNEGGFNKKEYLKTKKIYGIVNTKLSQIKLQKKNNCVLFLKVANEIGNQIKQQASKLLEKQQANLLVAILIGNKEDLSEEIQETFAKSNLSHMLAVSGAHVSYVMLAITGIMSVIKIGKRKSKILTIFLLIFFLFLTGHTSSVTRACCMAIYFIMANLCHRKVSIYSAIFLSMLLLMLENPYCILEIGFQLSYAGTIGIVLFYPILKKRFIFIKETKSKYITKIFFKIYELMLITLSANLLLFPIILFHFNTISLTFLISNLLSSPIMGIVIILGFFTISLSFFFLPIGRLLSVPLSFCLKLFLQIATFTGSFPFSQITLPTPKITWIILYYFALFFLFFYKKQIANLIKEKKSKKIIIIIILIFTIIYFGYEQIPQNFQLYFIDIGQGDSSLIITPYQKSLLVDGGGSENFDIGKNTLIPYLLDRRITSLDYVLISHFDSDHVKGILSVLEKIKVGTIIISKQTESCENYEIFKKIVTEKRIRVLMVKKGDNISIDKEVTLQILWPKEEQIKENSLNNNSIVGKVKYSKFSILLTGDIEQIAEEAILKEYENNLEQLNATILKVAHHGSKTSSISNFLQQVKPKIALIGVGKDNTFGHPNVQVLQRLENYGVKIFRTDESGEIEILVNKKGKINIKTKLKGN